MEATYPTSTFNRWNPTKSEDNAQFTINIYSEEATQISKVEESKEHFDIIHQFRKTILSNDFWNIFLLFIMIMSI